MILGSQFSLLIALESILEINEDDPLQHELYAEIMFNVSEDIVSCHLVLASTSFEALTF